jgi:hypothetical protein
VGIVPGLVLAAPATAKAEDLRVRLDVEGPSSTKPLARLLKRVVKQSPGITLVSDQAEKVDVVVTVAVSPRRWRGRRLFRMTMTAVEASNGEQLAKLFRDLPRRIPTRSRAKNLVGRLLFKVKAARAKLAHDETTRVTTTPGPVPFEDLSQEDTAEETNGQAAKGAVMESATVTDDWDVDAPTFEEVEGIEKKSPIKTTMAGSVEVEHHRYFGDVDTAGLDADAPEKYSGRDSVDITLQLEASGDNSTAFAKAGIRHDASQPERNRVDLLEAYGEFRWGAMTVRAGRMIDTWGSASLYNPVDIINPSDLRDPLDREKLATWMVKVSWLQGPLLFEGFYLPVPEFHNLPAVEGLGSGGELLSRSRWIHGTMTPEQGQQVNLVLGTSEVLASKFKNVQGAARMALSTKSMDFALSYAYLFDRFPTASPVLESVGGLPTVRVDFVNNRQHVLAVEAEAVSGKFHFGAEVAAFFPEERESLLMDEGNETLRYASAVVSADYQTPQFRHDHYIHLFLDVTATRALTGTLPTIEEGGLRAPLEFAALGRVEYNAGSKLQVRFDFIEALDRFDLLVRPSIGYRVSDMLKAEVAVAWLEGSGAGFFGAHKENSRIGAKITAAY